MRKTRKTRNEDRCENKMKEMGETVRERKGEANKWKRWKGAKEELGKTKGTKLQMKRQRM